MAPTERAQPLRAAPRFTPMVEPDPDAVSSVAGKPTRTPDSATTQPRRRLRSALVGTGIGLAVTVAGVAIAFSIVAIPLYLLASTDPEHGMDRDLVRQGLFYVALPFGLIGGVLTGVGVGIWYGRGGRLPTYRRGIYDS